MSLQDLLCSVSVFHNCAQHKCGLSQTRTVHQEREELEEKGWEVNHIAQPDDLLLNFNQLTNALVLQPLHPLPIFHSLGSLREVVLESLNRQRSIAEAKELERQAKELERQSKEQAKALKQQMSEAKKRGSAAIAGPVPLSARLQAQHSRPSPAHITAALPHSNHPPTIPSTTALQQGALSVHSQSGLSSNTGFTEAPAFPTSALPSGYGYHYNPYLFSAEPQWPPGTGPGSQR